MSCLPERRAEVAKEAVKIGAKVLWGQIGVKHNKAAQIAEVLD